MDRTIHPCHPADCQCERCRCKPDAPHKTFPPHGFLLPRILASGREWLRRRCVDLDVSDLPPCAEAPLTLLRVQQSCQPPRWEMLPECGQRQFRLRVCIPVECQVRDANGCVYNGRSVVETEASLRLSFPVCECWRSQLMLLPCIRLIQPVTTRCEPCFRAEVELLLESYLTRWEPCMVGVPKPVCPELPLYPQPYLPG